MHRDLVLIALFSLCTNNYVEAKVCPTLDVRNNPKSLAKLRDCTIIMGHLHLVLMDRLNDSSVFDQYSFPELTEIVDYLMVFRIAGLTSLGKLFPNLRVIRGRRLFLGYAIIIYRVPHLQEIGLTNLQHIGRGAIKVDSCPNVCYVRTIDWQALGASMLDFPATEASDCKDQFCPNECVGNCWNNFNCQRRSSNYCEYFEDDGKCVHTCPKFKVVNYETMKCLTKEQCAIALNGTWWVFNNTCINSCPIFYDRDDSVDGGCRYMGEKYIRYCEGGVIDMLDVLEEMKGCTHINGSLEIRISNNNLEPFLEENLGNIVSITGYLKIGRSKAITSLEFLKNLTTIKGERLDNNKYSLFVFENQNLRRLWNFSNDFKLTIPTGTMAFHDNPQLCLSEIEKLENARGIHSKADMQISQYSNGYKSICNQKDLNVVFIEKNPTNVTLLWEHPVPTSNETILGYTVYYIQARSTTVTSFDGRDGCDADSWDGIFVRENTVQLKELIPYTQYDFYIKTYTTIRKGEETPIHNFKTASAEPTEPIDFIAEAASDTSILLKWSPPEYHNGLLTHYSIYMLTAEDHLPTIQQRNYCTYPHVVEIKEEPLAVNVSVNATKVENCTCPEKTFIQLVTEDLTCMEGGNKLDKCMKTIYQHQPSELSKGIRKREMGQANEAEYAHSIVDVAANKTSYVFKNLKHYSLYIFLLSACNMKMDGGPQCGPSVMTSQRTKKKEKADTIRNLHVKIVSKSAKVEWNEPEEFNSVLVAYQTEYKRTDLEHSKPRFECITGEEYHKLGRKMLELIPGKYAIRVQAISLAGPGVFSEWQHFEISSEDGSSFAIYGPVVVALLVAVMVGLGYVWYRKKRLSDINHLITSINPDYAGPVYEEDDWEMDRSDIEFGRELGQGSFGMVYEGLIVSRRYACAIKTVTESASMPSRMEFLNEGSVMKTFNDGHHVVRLLGIVSRGQPPLVIMELMERGDLKSYLRRCREPSQNLTTNEMYRMAAEIADGMAYLTAKKFVHRDLAARNCMVGADRTVKIGDFGMARDIYETDYYRKETVGLLPVRWMAPESLADGVFTSDSDVWSYGVVLWEMATLAEQPYQGLSNEEVFQFVKSMGKLERPNECSDILYDVMHACWNWFPNKRPTFSDIVHRFVDHVGEDFRLVAFCFSRQGLELALNAGPRVYNPPAMLPQPEDDYFGHYDPAEEGVNLYARESNRPTKFLPFSNQRMNRSSPYHIRPGSPPSSSSSTSS